MFDGNGGNPIKKESPNEGTETRLGYLKVFLKSTI